MGGGGGVVAPPFSSPHPGLQCIVDVHWKAAFPPVSLCAGPVYASPHSQKRPACALHCRTHRNSSASEVTGSRVARLTSPVIHTAHPPTSLRGPSAHTAVLHLCPPCSPIHPAALLTCLAQSPTVLLTGHSHLQVPPTALPTQSLILPARLSAHPSPLLHPSGSALPHPTGTSSLSKPLSPVIDFLWQARLIDPDSQGFDYSVFEQSQK